MHRGWTTLAGLSVDRSSRVLRRFVPAVAVLAVMAGMLVASPSPAAAAAPVGAVIPGVKSTPTGTLTPRSAVGQSQKDTWSPPAAPVWPAAGSTVVDLS